MKLILLILGMLSWVISGAYAQPIYTPPAAPIASLTVSMTVDQAQASGGSTSVALASIYGINVGQSISGNGIPSGDTVSALNGGSQISNTANGAFSSGQNVITMNGNLGTYTGGMSCIDTTNPAALAPGSLISSINTGGGTITLNQNVAQNSSGASDTIVCDPVIVLSAATTTALSAGATIFTVQVSSITGGYVNANIGYEIGGQLVFSTPFAGNIQGAFTIGGLGACTGITSVAIETTAYGYDSCGEGGAGLTGVEDTFVGWNAGNAMTTGSYDTSVGVNSQGHETTGLDDTSIGTDSMRNSVGLQNSTAVGMRAEYNGSTSSGANLDAVGFQALDANATYSGTNVDAFGNSACLGASATTANDDICIGTNTLSAMTTAVSDVAVGFQAGINVTTSQNSVYIGGSAGATNATGNANAIVGNDAFQLGTTVTNETGLGANVGKNVTGTGNTLIGFDAGDSVLTTGSSNIMISTNASAVDASAAGQNDGINIGNSIVGQNSGATNPTVCTVGQQCIIGVIRSANLNSTADQSVVIAPFTSSNVGKMSAATKYIVTGMFVDNCSESISTAAGGLYTAASKGGITLVAASQVYSNCTSSTTMETATLAAASASNTLSGATLFFSLTTAQGSAATGDVYVLGIPYN